MTSFEDCVPKMFVLTGMYEAERGEWRRDGKGGKKEYYSQFLCLIISLIWHDLGRDDQQI